MDKKPKLMLVVEGDHNDADYIVSVTPITEKQLKKFLPLIKAIKEFQPYTTRQLGPEYSHNWPCGDYGHRPDMGEKSITELYPEIDPEIVKEFDQYYVPHAEDWNIHTIDRIFVVKHDRLLFRKKQ